jgi:hypothetical protein
MAAFEILVNGERRFIGEAVTAITLAADWVSRRNASRVSLHVGVGEPGERQVQLLGADLGPGDEISIRVLSDEERHEASPTPEGCSFCGCGINDVRSLVAGREVAICNSCIEAFETVLGHGAPLPLGASICVHGDSPCGFCQRSPPEVPGLFLRNATTICPECLRTCVDMTRPGEA